MRPMCSDESWQANCEGGRHARPDRHPAALPWHHSRLCGADRPKSFPSEPTMARSGMPSPTFAQRCTISDPGVTNVRNVASPQGRRWLGVENCGVCSSAVFPRTSAA